MDRLWASANGFRPGDTEISMTWGRGERRDMLGYSCALLWLQGGTFQRSSYIFSDRSEKKIWKKEERWDYCRELGEAHF